MRLIDADAVKERFKNDISGMEERKEKETNMLDRMEILSQLSFARYAYAVSIKEPTVPAITLDRVNQAREEISNYSDFHREHLYKTNPNYDVEQGQYLAYEKCLQIIDKLIVEVEGTK